MPPFFLSRSPPKYSCVWIENSAELLSAKRWMNYWTVNRNYAAILDAFLSLFAWSESVAQDIEMCTKRREFQLKRKLHIDLVKRYEKLNYGTSML